jgi:hypothetical protein
LPLSIAKQHQDMAAEPRGQVDVMQCCQRNTVTFADQAGGGFHDLQLVAHVEMIGRLIEQKYDGILNQQRGKRQPPRFSERIGASTPLVAALAGGEVSTSSTNGQSVVASTP